MPTMPLKEMSFARVLVPARDPSRATRRANSMMLVMQIVVEMDSTTVIAREALLSW